MFDLEYAEKVTMLLDDVNVQHQVCVAVAMLLQYTALLYLRCEWLGGAT